MKWIGRVLLVCATLALATIVAAFVLRPSMQDWPKARVGGGSGLQVVFMGTASAIIRQGDDVVVLDGFVTRPSVWRLLGTKLASDPRQVADAMRRSGTAKASAVLVAHSHFDHALDAAQWARLAKAQVWGTASTARISNAERVPAKVIAPGQSYQIGQLSVDVFGVDHSPGGRMLGEVEADFSVPARAGEYRNGGGLGYRIRTANCSILVVPSAGWPQQPLDNLHADVVLLSIGQLGLQSPEYIARYWQQTVEASGARLVVPIHWDDFTRPLRKPLVALPYAIERTDLAMEAITRLAGDGVKIGVPQVYQSLDLSQVCAAA